MIYLTPHDYEGNIKGIASKSDAHRSLICAALASDASVIDNVYFSDDVLATMDSLKSLGVHFEINKDRVTVKKEAVKVNNPVLEVNESGSTLRFLIPIASLFSNKVTYKVHGNLINRPLSVYEKLFKITKKENEIEVEGCLKPDIYHIDGSVSSQFISGLLFTLPLLDGNSKIIIENDLASIKYIYMTLDTLKRFGITVKFDEKNRIFDIPGNQKYKAVSYVVENDFSQAAFMLALGALTNHISVSGLNMDSFQADKNIIAILKDMNVKVEINKDVITTYKSDIRVSKPIDLEQNPDLGPILMGLAAYCENDVYFTGIRRLRIKESDRVKAMKENLALLGIDLEITDENNCVVHHGTIKETKKVLNSYNDHRIFMALAIITYNKNRCIDDDKCLSKSYPTFLNDLKCLERK